MGQKVHPYGFRLGFNKPWRSRWFSKQGYAGLLQEDLELKEGLRKQLKSAGVSSIEVDRPGNKLRVTIRTSRPSRWASSRPFLAVVTGSEGSLKTGTPA